jgi:hypothetical protein
MLEIKRLRSRNPAVRVFHVVDEKGKAVGLITEEHHNENTPGVSDWRINRLLAYEMVDRLDALTEEAMLGRVNGLIASEPSLFEGHREYFYIQVVTAFGKTLNFATRDDESFFSGVYKDLMTFPNCEYFTLNNLKHFAKQKLLEDGDWPIEFRIVQESSHLIEKVYQLNDPANIY